jgi:hypothetical protein
MSAPFLSIFVKATTNGVPASMIASYASSVCGFTPFFCSDDEDGDICSGSAARAKHAEGFVARRVEEGDGARLRLVLVHDLVGRDVLRDAAGFAGGNVRLPDVIQKGRLAMVDMTHDRDYRRARS